jgi:hypothetical protein
MAIQRSPDFTSTFTPVGTSIGFFPILDIAVYLKVVAISVHDGDNLATNSLNACASITHDP